jgi:hypothetical protein
MERVSDLDYADSTLGELRAYLIHMVYDGDEAAAPSESTIAKVLHNQLITLKQSKGVPNERNSPRTIQLRREHSEWFMGLSGVERSRSAASFFFIYFVFSLFFFLIFFFFFLVVVLVVGECMENMKSI